MQWHNSVEAEDRTKHLYGNCATVATARKIFLLARGHADVPALSLCSSLLAFPVNGKDNLGRDILLFNTAVWQTRADAVLTGRRWLTEEILQLLSSQLGQLTSPQGRVRDREDVIYRAREVTPR